ncbi:H(+)/Cl(-) exchange transporter 6-like isoform X2 [Branchiostoma lanceolatum]|uniref:H(+)/Cl(-) exchange transporter 6-like isoform X2 n=1 Tax=Branchiostoma lanceolatum TaxID=7740 RepID=UPI003452E603
MAAARLCFGCCGRREEDPRPPEEMTLLGEGSQEEEEHLPRKDYESLDYDCCFNEPYIHMLEKQDSRTSSRNEAVRWVVTLFVGIFTGLVALFIDVVIKELMGLKVGIVKNCIELLSVKGYLVLSLLVLLAFNLTFTFISGLFTAAEPLAAGSGIPEVKCYLNGVKVPRVVRLFTLVCKAVGVLFSVAGGLLVGKEGPMIHSGAVIGAGVPQRIWRKLGLQQRDKRDFASSGAAAGVAAAFGAPIGGVLFSLEEGSSFWNQMLTWRTFLCSMTAAFTLNFFLSGTRIEGENPSSDDNSWGSFYQPGLLTFGQFKCPEGERGCQLWTVLDLFVFIVMGVVGGLLGALFNAINTRLTKHRMKHVHNRHPAIRVLEVLLVTMVTTIVAFTAAMTLGECKEVAPIVINATSPVEQTVQYFFCPNGTYNDMATLFFNTQETSIRQLFHQEATFSLQSLGIFFLLFFILSCWTYGASVPSGLFVPSLLCGAAYGRFVGNLLKMLPGFGHIYSGTFSLIGAAAFLGGVVRMTISLTVILIESTNEISYGLPIMIVLMVAKFTGDLFNEGLYDIHIELKGVPLLEWHPPHGMDRLCASDIMETSLSYIYPHTRIQSIVSILRTTRHHAYPVVTENHDSMVERRARAKANTMVSNNIKYRNENSLTRANEQMRRIMSRRSAEIKILEDQEQRSRSGSMDSRNAEEDINFTLMTSSVELYRGLSPTAEDHGFEGKFKPLTFHGLILRHQLITLLSRGVCYAENTPSSCQPTLTYEELTEDYPRWLDIHDVDLTQLHPRMIMDVTPYMNPCPYTVSPNTPVPQVFKLFRTMGLRHLPVTNDMGEIVGIVTRHNLTTENLKQKLKDSQHLA